MRSSKSAPFKRRTVKSIGVAVVAVGVILGICWASGHDFAHRSPQLGYDISLALVIGLMAFGYSVSCPYWDSNVDPRDDGS